MVFYNGRIVREDRVIEKGSVRVEDGKIVEIREIDEGKGDIDLKGKYLAPGIVDLHTFFKIYCNNIIHKFHQPYQKSIYL